MFTLIDAPKVFPAWKKPNGEIICNVQMDRVCYLEGYTRIFAAKDNLGKWREVKIISWEFV